MKKSARNVSKITPCFQKILYLCTSNGDDGINPGEAMQTGMFQPAPGQEQATRKNRSC